MNDDLWLKVLALHQQILKIVGLKNSVMHKKWKTLPPEQMQVLLEQMEYDLARWKWADKNRSRCIATTTQGTRCTRKAEAGDYTCPLHRDTIPTRKNTIEQGESKCLVYDKWGRLCAMPKRVGEPSCGFHKIEQGGGA